MNTIFIKILNAVIFVALNDSLLSGAAAGRCLYSWGEIQILLKGCDDVFSDTDGVLLLQKAQGGCSSSSTVC